MEYSEKIAHWHEYSKKVGLTARSSPNWLFKQYMRFEISPPIFWGFSQHFIQMMVVCMFVNITVYITSFSSLPNAIEVSIMLFLTCFVPSFAVGWLEARKSKKMRKRLKLDTWENFPRFG